MTYPDLLVHADPAGATDAAELLNLTLGDGCAHPDDLLALQDDGGILVRAVDDGLLGAATARVLDNAETGRLLARLQAGGVNDGRLAGERIGELKSSAVTPAARGRGIGTALAEARLRHLHARGCRYVICASWASGDPEHSSLGILERAGFERIGAIAGYWRDEQQTGGYDCPECGPVCVCVAVIMILALDP